MPIQQTKKQSDLEKRLRLLRQQVYGKNSEEFRSTQNIGVSEHQTASKSKRLTYRHTDISISSGFPSRSESFQSDLTYLYQDLKKISILASVALGAQIISFILLKNHLLNLKLF